MRVLSREQVRRLDQDAVQQLGLPSLLLMENAARGLSAAVRLLLSPPGSAAGVGTGAAAGVLGRIVIAAGAGNNGGDGLALARLLAAEGVPAEVLLFRCGRSLSPDAAANLGFLQRAGLLVSECGPQQSGAIFAGLSAADLIVDALLGTGVRGAPQEPLSLVIQQINA
ncbi:MAG: NAD(P)H-hydrate epimerase, partial [Planctomycetaceae bacterium]